jgi:23S rRNA (cytosine1962-C5)-methyltransferase
VDEVNLRNTYLTEAAEQRMKQGLPWAFRDEILSMDGQLEEGEPVELRGQDGRSLGLADIDLQSPVAVRRIGLPHESREGLIPRHLRAAFERRVQWIDDPRFCRIVNDDGDGLPGLIVDRFDQHYVVQTFTRAMDTRVEEIARALAELTKPSSITLRQDSPRRARLKLGLERPRVLSGTPPRWSRLLELGARITFDLQMGLGTGYFYDLREVRERLLHLAPGARVLDLCCYVGGLFVHAGRAGARSIVAVEKNSDACDLARENAEVNGLIGRTRVVCSDVLDYLESSPGPFDLVLLDPPFVPSHAPALGELLRGAVRATRHGGRMIAIAPRATLSGPRFEQALAEACEQEGRFAVKMAQMGLPADFPMVLAAAGADPLHAVALEIN